MSNKISATEALISYTLFNATDVKSYIIDYRVRIKNYR